GGRYGGDEREVPGGWLRALRRRRRARARLTPLEGLQYIKNDISMTWTVEFLNDAALAELEAMPADIKALFARVVELIEGHGLERVGEPHVKHLQGKLWEMRMKGRDGIARSLYVTATGRRAVVLRTFAKKTQKTPRREIELALERAKELK